MRRKTDTAALVGLLLISCLASPAQDWPLKAAHPRWTPKGARKQLPGFRTFDVEHVRIALTPDFEKRSISARTDLTIRTLHPGFDRIRLDAVGLRVSACEVKGIGRCKFRVAGDRLTVLLARSLPEGRRVVVSIHYRATPRLGMYFTGPEPARPDFSRTLHTQGESIFNRHWFPCHDSPDDMATSEVVVTVPKDLYALSNGRLLLPAGAELPKVDPGGKTRTFHWRQEKPHVSYLVTLVVGPYEVIRDSWRGRPLLYLVPRGAGRLAGNTFRNTRKMLDHFSTLLGVEYPWSKYAQACVIRYEGGGMENTSATTLTTDTLHDDDAHLEYRSEPLIAHELAHQWFGDLVTCRTWAHIWLNEGFATYLEGCWREHAEGSEALAWGLDASRGWYFYEDARRYRRPIVTNLYAHPSQLFDGHTYAKGSLVLHMLRHVLGTKVFWKALRLYLTRHRHRPVSTRDLRAACEEASGKPLAWFFDQWLAWGGHPEYVVTKRHDPVAGVLLLEVEQVQRTDDHTPLFRMPVDVEITTPEGTRRHRIEVARRKQTFAFYCPSKPLMVRFDKGSWILKQLKFDKPVAEWLHQLASDDDVMGRRQAANGLLAHLGKLEVRAGFEQAIGRDASWELRRHLATALGAAIHGRRWNPWEERWMPGKPAAKYGKTVEKWVARTLVSVAARDAESRVRTAALYALPFLSGDDVEKALRGAGGGARNPYGRAAALRSLGRMKARNVRPLLRAALALGSHRETVRKAALAGLEMLGDDEAVQIASRWVRPGNPTHLRFAGLAALSRRLPGDGRVVELFLSLLADANSRMRGSLAEKLGGVTGEADRTQVLSALRQRLRVERQPRVVEKLNGAIARLEKKPAPAKLASKKGTGDPGRARLAAELEVLRAQKRLLQLRIRQLELKINKG